MIEIIERTNYLDKLKALQNKSVIKVVTGVRRCGKSVLLESFQKWLISNGIKKNNIISINFEDYEHKDLREPDNLYKYIKQRLKKDMTYIFLDEIQLVKDFPEVVDSLFIKKNTDIYITGSNANLLSSEIATLLSGRYIEISMLPLSFKEFYNYHKKEQNLQKLYNEYITNGAFPYTLAFNGSKSEIKDYLEGIFNTIVFKYIAQRANINDFMMLESVVRFIFDNIGNPVSSKRIADTMTSSGRKIDQKTVEKYLKSLLDSFIFYKADRFDVKGMQLLKTLNKYYAVDLGLRTMLLGEKGIDVGHILENIVFLELKRRGFKVYVGKVGNLEVDFVAESSEGLSYYQVASTVRDNSVLKRELTPMQMIHDHYPKTLLTLDDDPPSEYNGIRKRNALEWLVGN